MVALGSMFVIMAGGLDLTVGIGVSLAILVFEVLWRATNNITLTILATFASVIILGIINGILVTKVKIVSVVATLIMMTIVQGAVSILTRYGTTESVASPLLLFISRGTIIGIPTAFFITMIVFIIGYIVLNHTRFGFYISAIGNNAEGVRLVGINFNKYVFFTYLVSGFCMGLAALMIASRVLYISPGLGGTSLLLDALVAVVIGGVVITGGKGTVRGVFVGSIAITIINNMVNVADIHAIWNEFFKGVIILIVLVINELVKLFEEKTIK
jgi:ribose/xylose/arabinose/galactoside ABC-type transport system permease subunit